MGALRVQELDWNAEDKLKDTQPPYDYVLAADCVYHEHHLERLLDTILQLTDHRSTGKCLEGEVRFL